MSDDSDSKLASSAKKKHDSDSKDKNQMPNEE